MVKHLSVIFGYENSQNLLVIRSYVKLLSEIILMSLNIEQQTSFRNYFNIVMGFAGVFV